MPSENEKRISDLTLVTAQNVTEDTLVELSVEDQSSASGHSSYAGKLSTIMDKILNAFRFNTRLQTTNKTVFGAINEIAQGGGGGASSLEDLDDVNISSPTDGQALIYDGTNQEWINGEGGGGSANLTELTQAEYDALEQAGQLEEDMMYFITDGQSGNEIIDDSTTSASKVWSSDKVSDELDTKQDDLSGGSLSNVDLNDYTESGNYWVTQTRVLNKPVTNFGYLEVLQCSSGLYMQMFTAFAADNNTSRGETYVRFYANSQWYGWNKIADSTPDTIKVTRTNLTQQGGGLNTFVFAAPAITGYTRMVVGFNPSVSSAMYVRSEDDGDNIKVLIQNNLGTSITYDVTIAVAYIRN